ncbi:MAG: hypothetical protein KA479_04005 [Saprospiraceae bacterium]|nr:hypothetical protein [Saprospiraceae bacterium]
MNKGILFLILYICLFAIETIFSFLMVLLYYSFESFDVKGSFDSAILWNLWRILFYGIPFIILYFILFKYFESIKLYKPLLFSLFNLFVYVGLSVLARVIWGKNVPLPPEGIMFWVTCVAIFLSPLIVGQIPYFKKLIESL